jgi:hypothetical protein
MPPTIAPTSLDSGIVCWQAPAYPGATIQRQWYRRGLWCDAVWLSCSPICININIKQCMMLQINLLFLKITGFMDLVRRSKFWILQNTTSRKLGLPPSSGEGREMPTLLGPSERASLNHWTSCRWALLKGRNIMFPFPVRKTERDPVSGTLCLLLSGIPDDGRSRETHPFWVLYTSVSQPFFSRVSLD